MAGLTNERGTLAVSRNERHRTLGVSITTTPLGEGDSRGMLDGFTLPLDSDDVDVREWVRLLEAGDWYGFLAAADDPENESLRRMRAVVNADDAEKGFHESLHRQPGDATGAGAYADWLAERGRPATASVIRSHAGIARVGGPINYASAAETRTIFTPLGIRVGEWDLTVSEGVLEIRTPSRSRDGAYLSWRVNVGSPSQPWVAELIRALQSESSRTAN